MARKKKEEAAEAVEMNETPQVSTDDLLQLIAQMKQTMEAQSKKIEELEATKKHEPAPVNNYSDNKKNIERRTVTITSLYRGSILCLNGDHSHWLNFGESESMSAKEAIKIVENAPQLLEQGFFSVDPWLAEELGWTVNEHLMTQDELNEFFNTPDDKAIEMFIDTTPGQRTSIIDYIESRILGDGEFENINLAMKIGQMIGKDYLKLLNDNQLDDEDRAMLRKG